MPLMSDSVLTAYCKGFWVDCGKLLRLSARDLTFRTFTVVCQSLFLCLTHGYKNCWLIFIISHCKSGVSFIKAAFHLQNKDIS